MQIQYCETLEYYAKRKILAALRKRTDKKRDTPKYQTLYNLYRIEY
jgi:hypothetical protein